MSVKTKSDKRTALVTKLKELQDKAREKGIGQDKIQDVFLGLNESDSNANDIKRPNFDSKEKNSPKYLKEKRNSFRCVKNISIFVGVFACVCALVMYSLDIDSLESAGHFVDNMVGSKCLVDNNGFMIEVARPLVNCHMCESLREVPVEKNISSDEFLKRYAYSSVPVLIKDATANWTAMSSFSFHFFKELYTNTKNGLSSVEEECQFFPYKTEFETLEDVFSMSDERAAFKEGEKPWYIGWSNCNKEIQKILREHYQRPYFLPSDSESSIIDWMFMGGSGLGAFIHLDYVQRPSWQAQISGRKTWTLIPSPECESTCTSMNVTVEKGDIFVVDTNVWYHSTFIHPGEISITIGSEYD